MVEISAALVKELRDKTDAGMMDCKKALIEANGDMEKAIEYLRKIGAVKAEKKADRSVKEGSITSYINGPIGVLVELLCETDFVAKNEKFRDLLKNLAETAATIGKEGDICDELKKLTADKITQTIAIIGENIQLTRAVKWISQNGTCAAYLHMGGKIAVLIEAEGSNDPTVLNNICMHIAAFSPKYIAPENVPAEVLAKEREIAASQVDKNKPSQIIEKIVEGKLNKWFTEVCLMKQPWIRDDKIATEKAIPGVKVKRFIRWQVGETI